MCLWFASVPGGGKQTVVRVGYLYLCRDTTGVAIPCSCFSPFFFFFLLPSFSCTLYSLRFLSFRDTVFCITNARTKLASHAYRFDADAPVFLLHSMEFVAEEV